MVTRFFALPLTITSFYYVAQLLDPHRTIALDGRHQRYFDYVCVNLVFVLLQSTALQAFPQTVRGEQLLGSLEPILATPTPPWVFFIAEALWPITLSAAQAAFGLAIATRVFGLDLAAANFGLVSIFIVLGALAMAALGLIATALVIAFRVLPPTGQFVGGVGALLSGLLFPPTLLPGPLQVLSWCLPLTHALRGLRGAMGGVSAHALAPDALWLAAFALVGAPCAYAAALYAIEHARERGTLDQA